MEIVYADNNATTQVAPEVVEEMLPFLKDRYANPSSMYSFGGDVSKDVEKARIRLAECLGASSETEIIFTSCGTESDNTAIRSALACRKGRKKIITTRVEHPAILTLVRNLERDGYLVDYLPVDENGNLDLNLLEEKMSEDVAVVSVMAANNETGVLFPVLESAKIAHRYGALFHTDAVQAIGKISLDLKSDLIDMLSLSGHKIHAPKGVGALYVRRGIRFRPFILGGHQERGRRGGTDNVPGIAALGKAAQLAKNNMTHEQTTVRKLRDRLEEGLLKIKDARVNGDKKLRLPGTTNISFKRVEGEAILMHLDKNGICASSGSACTSGSLEPSHVLRAMGIPFNYAHGSIRFSLGRYNTEEHVGKILDVIPGIIKNLREISPFKD